MPHIVTVLVTSLASQAAVTIDGRGRGREAIAFDTSSVSCSRTVGSTWILNRFEFCQHCFSFAWDLAVVVLEREAVLENRRASYTRLG